LYRIFIQSEESFWRVWDARGVFLCTLNSNQVHDKFVDTSKDVHIATVFT